MRSLVTNMGNRQNPWEDVPVEVLIEYERKRKKQLEDQREQLRIPLYSPDHSPLNIPPEKEIKEDYKIVIDFV